MYAFKCTSILKKTDELKSIMFENSVDITLITESWTNESILSAEFHIDGYVTFRKDCEERIGGGCLVYVRETLYYIPDKTILGNPKILGNFF